MTGLHGVHGKDLRLQSTLQGFGFCVRENKEAVGPAKDGVGDEHLSLIPGLTPHLRDRVRSANAALRVAAKSGEVAAPQQVLAGRP